MDNEKFDKMMSHGFGLSTEPETQHQRKYRKQMEMEQATTDRDGVSADIAKGENVDNKVKGYHKTSMEPDEPEGRMMYRRNNLTLE